MIVVKLPLNTKQIETLKALESPCTQTQLAKRLGIKYPACNGRLSTLVQRGFVSVGPTIPFVYRLTDAGRAEIQS